MSDYEDYTDDYEENTNRHVPLVNSVAAVGLTKKFADVSKQELRKYCEMIMDEDYTAFSAEDVQFELMKRFKWNVSSRMNEIDAAWKSRHPESRAYDDNNCENDNDEIDINAKRSEAKAANTDTPTIVSASNIKVSNSTTVCHFFSSNQLSLLLNYPLNQ